MIARIGGDWGVRLTRACFGVILKFSDDLEDFLKLAEAVDFTSKDIGDAEAGDQKLKSIVQQLKTTTNEEYFKLLKHYEQAAWMRKWTQKAKLNLSERIDKEEEEKLRKEITEANPSKGAFVDPFDDTQLSLFRARSTDRFDAETPKKY